MKTLIATILVLTSLTASAEHNRYVPNPPAGNPPALNVGFITLKGESGRTILLYAPNITKVTDTVGSTNLRTTISLVDGTKTYVSESMETIETMLMH